MRAKPVMPTAYVFDFDDTLIKSDVKTHVYRDGQFFKSLSAEEYNTYQKQSNDTYDMSDFDNPALIADAETYIMWPLLEKYDKNEFDIYILTARHPEAIVIIHNFLITHGIKNLPIENIFAVGDNLGLIDIPIEKRKVLELVAKEYTTVNFYDDNIATVDFVKDIPNLFAYLVE